jgi:putative hydrolase of the HAD superfamily
MSLSQPRLAQPKVIFLDAVGTLFGIRGSVGEIYQRFAAAAGVMVDAEALNKAFFQSFAAAPRAAFPGVPGDQIPALEYAWWRAVAARSFEQVEVLPQFPNFDQFFRPLFDHFLTAEPWALYPEVPEILTCWRSAGIQLGVLSNFDSRLQPVLAALEISQFFGSVTISTAVGAAKPEAKIFRMALAQHHLADLPAEQSALAWHIGDSWKEDVVGAHGAGLTPIWLNRDNPTFADATAMTERQPSNVRMISRLSELASGIGGR